MAETTNIEYSDNLDIITKNTKDILDDMCFKDEDERLLCESIIVNLEKQVSDNAKNMKAVALPQLGVARINPVKHKFKKEKENLKLLRSVCKTAKEYKEEVADIYNKIREEQEKIDKDKLKYHKLKQNNKKVYEEYCKKGGKRYADCYLYCLTLVDYVPYDSEWEEHYQSLKD